VVGPSSAGTVTLNSTEEVGLGTQSIKLVTNGSGGTARVDVPVTVDMTNKSPVLRIHVDDLTKIGNGNLYLGTASNFTNHYRFPVIAPGVPRFLFAREGAWVKFTAPWSSAVVAGTPTRSGITHARFAVSDASTGPITVYFDGFAYQPETPLYPQGVCVFGFDDGRASAIAAKRILDRYGFAATNYPIAERIDQGTASPGGSWSSYADLEAMLESGWDIAQHAYSVAAHDAVGGFTSLTQTQLEDEFAKMKAWAAFRGYHAADHLAYPQSEHNQLVLDCSRRFFSSARTTISGTKETFPAADPYRVRVGNLGGAVSVATAQTYIDAAVAGKGMAVFVGHNVGNGGTGLDWSEANYESLIAYAASSGIAVRTMSQAVRGL
jgi:peptidoglycan/xylan/chitin deacetylase (PgdA/CDA1 family)